MGLWEKVLLTIIMTQILQLWLKILILSKTILFWINHFKKEHKEIPSDMTREGQ